MTISEVIEECKKALAIADRNDERYIDLLITIIKALEQQPCEDCISRQEVEKITWEEASYTDALNVLTEVREKVRALPSVTLQPKIGHCKDCKHFEYDSVAKVDGVPLIVAHEICSRWGDGCKTSEEGYCFLFEPKMQEVEE